MLSNAMKFRKLLILSIVIILLSNYQAYSANDNTDIPSVIPPSPSVSALFKANEIPISLSTGLPLIDLPIYTITEGNIEVPISITYNGGGIKVLEYSSIVGLGWQLNAGGCVTRTVFGYPDELKTNEVLGIFNANAKMLNLESAIKSFSVGNESAIDPNNAIFAIPYNNCNLYNDGYWDLTSDIFKLRCCGLSATFAFQPITKKIELSSNSYIEICKNISTVSKTNIDINPFNIKDDKYNLYEFSTIEKTYMPLKFKRGGIWETDSAYYTSTWHISKITDIGKRQVTFEYSDAKEKIIDSSVNDIFAYNIETKDNDKNFYKEFIHSGSQVRYFEKVLSIIKTPSTIVKFKYSNGNKILRNIIVCTNDAKEKEILKYEFIYINYSDKDKILLKEIKQYGNDNTTKPIVLYSFVYDSEKQNLNVNKKSQDICGYYNGAENKYLLCDSEFDYPYAPKCNRKPNFDYTRRGNLVTIKYPTGGQTNLEWELNDYSFIKDASISPKEEFDSIVHDHILRWKRTVPVTSYLGGDMSIQINAKDNVFITVDITKYVKPLIDGGSAIAEWKEYDKDHFSEYPTDIPQIIITDDAGNTLHKVFIDKKTSDSKNLPFFSLPKGRYYIKLLNPVNFEGVELNHINGYFGTGSESSDEFGYVKVHTYEKFSLGKSYIRKWPGLRLKRMVSSAGSVAVLKKEFDYHIPGSDKISSGSIFEEPYHLYTRYSSIFNFLGDRLGTYHSVFNEIGTNGLSSTPTGSAHIDYSYVTETYPDTGFSITSNITSQRASPDEINATYYELVPAANKINTSLAFERGDVVGKEYFDNGKLYKSEFTDYDYIYNSSGYYFLSQPFRIMDWDNMNVSTDKGVLGSQYVATTFRIMPYVKRINSNITSDVLHNVSMSDTVSFTYFSDNIEYMKLSKLIKTKSIKNSKGYIENTYYSYAAINNQITDLKETEVTVCNNKIIKAIRYEYDKNLNIKATYTMPLNIPYKSDYIIKIDARTPQALIDDINMNVYAIKYNDIGNIVEITKCGVPVASYIWGYQGSHPIAEVKNISYENMCNLLTSDLAPTKLLTNVEINDQTLSKLRDTLSGYDVTTYLYHWLIGACEITDTRGTVTKYDYDDFGRLKTKKDFNNYYIEHYEYNYEQ